MYDALYVAHRIPADEIEQVELFTGQPFNAEDTALWFHGTQHKIACRSEEETIALCGFSCVGPGVWRTFYLASENAWAEHGRELTAHTKAGMEEIMQREGIRRLETLCLASRKRAQAWYRVLGLRFESTLQSYAVNGEDAVMFVKVEK